MFFNQRTWDEIAVVLCDHLRAAGSDRQAPGHRDPGRGRSPNSE